MKVAYPPQQGPTTAVALPQVHREPQEVHLGNVELVLLLLLLASWVCYALRRLQSKAKKWDLDYPQQRGLDQVWKATKSKPRLQPQEAPRPRL